jgi:hypothetical protein
VHFRVGLAIEILVFLAFLINVAMLYLVLSRGRQRYHYLFAGALAVYALWSLGFFLFTFRNDYLNELIIYYSIFTASLSLSVPFIYHFTCSYLNRPRKKSTIFIWAFTVIIAISNLIGLATGIGPMTLVSTEWGNYMVFEGGIVDLIIALLMGIVSFVFLLLACWYLFRARRDETSPVARHHMQYIFISFIIISLLHLTRFLFPSEFAVSRLMPPILAVVTAAFSALVAIAIIKKRLLDITVVIKKTTIYSLLLALVVIIFSLSEHMLATYVGKFFGEHSFFIHIISIVVVIAILMPVRQRIERRIERFFEKKKVEF